jgi:hypothetical protein
MKAGPAKQNLGLKAPVLTIPGEELAILRQIRLGDRVPSRSGFQPHHGLHRCLLRHVVQLRRGEIPRVPSLWIYQFTNGWIINN